MGGQQIGMRQAVTSVLLAAVLFSTSGVAQQVAGAGSTPLGVGVMRLSVGGLFIVLLLPLFGQRRGDVIRLWRRPSVVIASVGAGGFQVTFFASVEQAGVALGTLIVVGSAPVFAGLLGWVFLRHRPLVSWAVATTVCVAGLALLSATGITGGSVAGIALGLVAGLSIATYTVAAKQVLDTGIHATLLMASTFCLGTLLLIPLFVMQPLAWIGTARGLLLVLYLGVFTMAVANWLHVRALSVLGPAPVTTLMLAEPMVATLFGVLLLSEAIGSLGLLGMVLVVIGLGLQGIWLARDRSADMRSAVTPV
jgi:drug/metabolite transporter, DME family